MNDEIESFEIELFKIELFELKIPVKWQAGSENTPKGTTFFFFDCADCGAHEPEIAGFLGTGPHYAEIIQMGTLARRNLRPAMFCRTCFDKRMAEASSTQP